jgi:hypothetical protein
VKDGFAKSVVCVTVVESGKFETSPAVFAVSVTFPFAAVAVTGDVATFSLVARAFATDAALVCDALPYFVIATKPLIVIVTCPES